MHVHLHVSQDYERTLPFGIRNVPREVSFLLNRLRLIGTIHRGDLSPFHLIHLQFLNLVNDISDDKIGDNLAFTLSQ